MDEIYSYAKKQALDHIQGVADSMYDLSEQEIQAVYDTNDVEKDFDLYGYNKDVNAAEGETTTKSRKKRSSKGKNKLQERMEAFPEMFELYQGYKAGTTSLSEWRNYIFMRVQPYASIMCRKTGIKFGSDEYHDITTEELLSTVHSKIDKYDPYIGDPHTFFHTDIVASIRQITMPNLTQAYQHVALRINKACKKLNIDIETITALDVIKVDTTDSITTIENTLTEMRKHKVTDEMLQYHEDRTFKKPDEYVVEQETTELLQNALLGLEPVERFLFTEYYMPEGEKSITYSQLAEYVNKNKEKYKVMQNVDMRFVQRTIIRTKERLRRDLESYFKFETGRRSPLNCTGLGNATIVKIENEIGDIERAVSEGELVFCTLNDD